MLFKKEVDGKSVVAVFGYWETHLSVYQIFRVTIDGKGSNLKGLKEFLSSEEPEILSGDGYSCDPAEKEGERRKNEELRTKEVRDFFLCEGFTECIENKNNGGLNVIL